MKVMWLYKLLYESNIKFFAERSSGRNRVFRSIEKNGPQDKTEFFIR